MTNEEFSNEFQTLVNSYRRFKDFDNKEELDSIDFDEYEKSLFLTEAQEQIVIELYSGRNDKEGSSFEQTEELRTYLRNLIRTEELTPGKGSLGVSPKSKFFNLPEDLLFIIYETVALSDKEAGCKDGWTIQVIPVTHDEYNRLKENPFRRANIRRALRLDNGPLKVEIVSEYNISAYILRYLSRPRPIVLRDFSEVSINGVNTFSECELDPAIHRDILERAVSLALKSKGISSTNEQ